MSLFLNLFNSTHTPMDVRSSEHEQPTWGYMPEENRLSTPTAINSCPLVLQLREGTLEPFSNIEQNFDYLVQDLCRQPWQLRGSYRQQILRFKWPLMVEDERLLLKYCVSEFHDHHGILLWYKFHKSLVKSVWIYFICIKNYFQIFMSFYFWLFSRGKPLI